MFDFNLCIIIYTCYNVKNNYGKVELLPYHTMGTYKYEQLGLDYPLKGVEPLSKERLDNAKAIFSRYKPENNKA